VSRDNVNLVDRDGDYELLLRRIPGLKKAA
jgi:hypothetical protein